MTKNRTPTPVYLDPGMHSGLEVKGLKTERQTFKMIFKLLCIDWYPHIFEPSVKRSR